MGRRDTVVVAFPTLPAIATPTVNQQAVLHRLPPYALWPQSSRPPRRYRSPTNLPPSPKAYRTGGATRTISTVIRCPFHPIGRLTPVMSGPCASPVPTVKPVCPSLPMREHTLPSGPSPMILPTLSEQNWATDLSCDKGDKPKKTLHKGTSYTVSRTQRTSTFQTIIVIITLVAALKRTSTGPNSFSAAC